MKNIQYLPPNPTLLGLSCYLVPDERQILTWPSACLRAPAHDVEHFAGYIEQLVYDMAYTMNLNNGFGLAAPQIGKSLNVITMMDISEVYDTENPTTEGIKSHTETKYLVFINPKIISKSSTTIKIEEGCLSIPGYFEKRLRSDLVEISYQDISGNEKDITLEGTNAFVFLHEFDHLQGKLFIDDLSKLKQNRIFKKVNKTIKHQK